MTGAIARLALRHRAIVLALTALFTIAGVNAFRDLPVEAYPDVTNVAVQVITLFPGHAAEEVERLVTIPVENQMNGIPKRTSIRSISLFGLSQVTITFEDDAEVEFVRNQAMQYLAAVALPAGAEANLSPNATPIGEIFRYTLKAPKGFPEVELKSLQDWVVERQFRTVPGMVDVVGFGGPTKQYQVLIDPAKLRSYDVTLSQVYDALSKGNQNAGGSYIEHGPELYVVRGLGFIQGLEDIRGIAVDTRKGTPIRIGISAKCRSVTSFGWVASARSSRASPTRTMWPWASSSCAGARTRWKCSNALEPRWRRSTAITCRRASRSCRTTTARTSRNARCRPPARTWSRASPWSPWCSILFFGLGNVRSALTVAVVVPLSLLGAYFLLDWRGIPANLIALGAIDFGIIVDSSVIIVEDILRKLEQDGDRTRLLHEVIIEAVKQMGRPILFSKVILLTAFVPLYTLQRVEGRIFRPMALTLTFALVTGTILALTLVPVLRASPCGPSSPASSHGSSASSVKATSRCSGTPSRPVAGS